MIGPGPSTRPYLIRALHDWCTDNGFTPYLAVYVDETVQVPTEYVKNREIVLNVGFEATSGLRLGNELIEFKARFGGVARDILVPVDHVVAIYARENGQGMAFPVPGEMAAARTGAASGQAPAAGALGDGPQSAALSQATPPEQASDTPASTTSAPAPAATPAAAKVVRLGAAATAVPASGRSARNPAATSGAADHEPPTPPKGRPPLKRVK